MLLPRRGHAEVESLPVGGGHPVRGAGIGIVLGEEIDAYNEELKEKAEAAGVKLDTVEELIASEEIEAEEINAEEIEAIEIVAEEILAEEYEEELPLLLLNMEPEEMLSPTSFAP